MLGIGEGLGLELKLVALLLTPREVEAVRLGLPSAVWKMILWLPRVMMSRLLMRRHRELLDMILSLRLEEWV